MRTGVFGDGTVTEPRLRLWGLPNLVMGDNGGVVVDEGVPMGLNKLILIA